MIDMPDNIHIPSCVVPVSKPQVDCIPLHAIHQVKGWDRTVQLAKAPVFYSTEFLHCIATAPLLEAQSAVLLLRSDEAGIAGVPVFLQHHVDAIGHLTPLCDQFPGLRDRPGVLGHCWHCYDSRIVAAHSEDSLESVIVALRSFARETGAEYFGLVNVSDPSTLEVMEKFGITCRYMVDRYVMDISRFAVFGDYVAELAPDARRELRRQYRHYEAANVTLTIEEPPFEHLDEVARLCRNTAARYSAEFYYPSAPLQLLLSQLSAVRLISIRIGGERIGVLICFFDPPRLHIWAAGMRYDRTRFSPYAVTVSEAIRYAIDRRLAVIEGGRGNGRVKKKQGFDALPLYACLQRTAA
jgi:hypothetical protein